MRQLAYIMILTLNLAASGCVAGLFGDTGPSDYSVNVNDGSLDVDPNDVVTVTFSSAVDSSTVTAQTFFLMEVGPVNASVSKDAGANAMCSATVVCDPLDSRVLPPKVIDHSADGREHSNDSDMMPNTCYVACMRGIQYPYNPNDGWFFVPNSQRLFVTGQSSGMSYIDSVGSDLTDGATNIDRYGPFSIPFNTALDPTTITTDSVYIMDEDGNRISVHVSYDAASKRLIITPDSPLAQGKTYSLVVTDAVKFASGESFPGYSARFSTSSGASSYVSFGDSDTNIKPGGKINISPSAPAKLVFGEAMDGSTINGSTVTLLVNGVAVAANVSYDAATRTLIVTPVASIPSGATVSIVLGAIKTASGSYINGDATTTSSITFTKGTALNLSAMIPQNGADDADRNGITVPFVDDMDWSTISEGTFYLEDSQGNRVPGTIVIDQATKTVSFVPDYPLEPGAEYTLVISNKVTNAAGVSIGNVRSTFETRSGGTSFVQFNDSDSNVSDGGTITSVGPDNPIKLKFIEAMDASTINSNNVRVYVNNVLVSATVSYNAQTGEVTVTPDSEVPPGATLKVVLDGDIKTAGGDYIGGEARTDADITMTVSGSSEALFNLNLLDPSDGEINVGIDQQIAVPSLRLLTAEEQALYVTADNFVLRDDTSAIEGINIWYAGDAVVITPSGGNWKPSMLYTLTVSEPVAFHFSFTTAASVPAYSINSWKKVDGGNLDPLLAEFGAALDMIDLGIDGEAETIIGAPGSIGDSGAFYVFSGANDLTGVIPLPDYTYVGPDVASDAANLDIRLGQSVAFIDSIDGDGLPDIAVGAPDDHADGVPDTGSVFAFHGAGGTRMGSWDSTANMHLGESLVGRCNTVTDTFILASGYLGDGTTGGVSQLLHMDGFGEELNNWYESSAEGEEIGRDLACGNLDGSVDGSTEVLVGTVNLPGAVAVLMSDGAATEITTLNGADNDVFGSSVSVIGDVNNDGKDDFVVGAPGEGANGFIHVYSGSGVPGGITLLHSIEGEATAFPGGVTMFGSTVKGIGDVDKDGTPDFAVGVPLMGEFATGRVYIYSGADWSEITHMDGDEGNDTHFGAAIASGDVNGDGVIDIVVGAPMGSPQGVVYFYLGSLN